MRNTIRLILIFLCLTDIATAQTASNWKPSPYFFQYKGLMADSLLILPKIIADPSLIEDGAVRYNIITGRIQLRKMGIWVDISEGTKALDSLRYDPATATFYTRYTTGGELAVSTGLVDSLQLRLTQAQADALYKLTASNGVSKIGNNIQLGGNSLTGNTIIPLSTFRLNLIGSGKTVMPVLDPNYRFNIIDSIANYFSTSIRNLRSDGIATLAVISDSADIVVGAKGSLSVVDSADGFTARRVSYISAGSKSVGFNLSTNRAKADFVFKNFSDTLLRIVKDTTIFKNKYLSIGGAHNLYPNVTEPPSSLDIGADSSYVFMGTNYGGAAVFHLRSTGGGTRNSPMQLKSGQILFSYGYRGWDGVKFSDSGIAFQGFAAEDFTPSATGCYAQIAITPIGVTGGFRKVSMRWNADNTIDAFGTIKVNGGGALLMGSAAGLGVPSDATANYSVNAHFIRASSANTRAVRFDYTSSTTSGGWEFYNSNTSKSLAFFQADGNVGIGVTLPTSTLQVNGSIAVKDTATTGSITLGAQTIIRVTNSTHTITLPTASTCRGRIYEVTNETAGTVTISSVIDYATGSGNTSILTHTTWRVYSDGTSWRLLSRSN